MNTNKQYRASALFLAALAALVLLTGGCGSTTTSYYNRIKRTTLDAKDEVLGTRPTTSELFSEDNTPLIDISYDAADDLMGLFMPALNKNSPIYYERFLNRIDPADPSPFGRLVAEQVVSRLALRNFKVTDGPAVVPLVKLPEMSPPSTAMTPTERKEDAKRADAEFSPPRPCILTGNYLIADKVVYMYAKLTALDNGQVMAAHSWTVPVNRNTRALLPQLKQKNGMRPTVRTSLGTSPHNLANPSGQPQNYVTRDLVR
jgi:hypothetical protein